MLVILLTLFVNENVTAATASKVIIFWRYEKMRNHAVFGVIASSANFIDVIA